ncbi:hypothetical protein Q1695_001130 [Nippostrongylus brasiliensis]|nr:hypothetical protein Q1695_001130 [Nippostrongylus brasiliensis]
MSLDIDISGGILQCHGDQYSCESLCVFECWMVRTCEHRTSFNYVCIPQPHTIIACFIAWCILTIITILVVGYSCWKFLRYRWFSKQRIHAGLIRSVSDLETRVQNPSMIVGIPAH